MTKWNWGKIPKLVIIAVFAMTVAGFAGFNTTYAQDASAGCIPGYDANSYTWDTDAGPSPCSVNAAVEALQASVTDGSDVIQYVTVQNGTPGNPTPTGWILATSGTEQVGVAVEARHVPKGACVDFDPGASKLWGEYDYVDYNPMWRRAHLKTDGAFSGLKATIYWTPCDITGDVRPQPDDMKSVPDNMKAGNTTANGNATPTSTTASPEAAAGLFNVAPLNDPANWHMAPGSTTQVVFNAPANSNVPAFNVPSGKYSVDYDAALSGGTGGANATSGQPVPAGAIVFTLNWL